MPSDPPARRPVTRSTPERIAASLPELYRPARTPTVLVVDDEPAISSFLRMGLQREGYNVIVAAAGDEALRLADETRLDLAILDVMLPGMDGIELCRRLRGDRDLLILMLTARDQVGDRVSGLDAGADDYLAKPFDFEELLARIRALLRRRIPEQWQQLVAGPFTLDERSRVVTRDGVEVELTPREFDLFRLFLRNPRQVLTRDVILDNVWGHSFYGDGNVVDVYVRYVRAKLDPEHRFIQTVRGLGYRLMA